MSGNFSNISDFTGFLIASDVVSGGMLAIGIPVLVWVATFAFALREGRGHAITYASFGTGILLLLLNIAGLVEYEYIIADVLLLLLGVYFLMQERRG